jgi:hypothetical protein
MPEEWKDLGKKCDAIYKVLRHLARNHEEGMSCVGDDVKTQELFELKSGLRVPVETGARVVFFASGEEALNHRGSVIIEVPPAGLENATDEELMGYILGNYPYWPPGFQAPMANLARLDMVRRRHS